MYIAKLKTIHGFAKMRTYFKLLDTQARTETKALGNQTPAKMKSIIRSNKVRPQEGQQSKLENAIDVEHFERVTEVGWGVGNISRLNSEAPHWKAINYGSSHMVGKNMPPLFTPGLTRPDSSKFREGRVNYGGRKGTGGGVPVTKPIPPMNYIQKTINFVNRQLNIIQTKLRRR